MGNKKIHHVAVLTDADVTRIAGALIEQQTEREEKAEKDKARWWRDHRKLFRVIFVTLAIFFFFAMEEYFHLKFAHKAGEVCIDCVADFLLFGSVE